MSLFFSTLIFSHHYVTSFFTEFKIFLSNSINVTNNTRFDVIVQILMDFIGFLIFIFFKKFGANNDNVMVLKE